MDLHHTPVKNEEATPISSDSEDDTFPPKKRVKHVSEQHRVFDLDLDLPELEPGIGEQWHAMFFRQCNSESAEMFKVTVTKCRQDITALQVASDKASGFYMKEFSALEEKKDCPYTSRVLNTIVTGKIVNDYIDTATKLLNSVEVDVETYLKSLDTIFIERDKAYGLYLEKLEQLAKITNVDKMIKYWQCEGKNYDDMEHLSGLTQTDICFFTHILRRGTQSNFDTEANPKDTENFGLHEITATLNEKVFVESIGKLRPFRDAYLKASAEVRERGMKHEENSYHVGCLASCLECAGVWLRVMHRQLKLLYDKGYDEMFFYYWRLAGQDDYESDSDDN